jgi:hypothetical protein
MTHVVNDDVSFFVNNFINYPIVSDTDAKKFVRSGKFDRIMRDGIVRKTDNAIENMRDDVPG